MAEAPIKYWDSEADGRQCPAIYAEGRANNRRCILVEHPDGLHVNKGGFAWDNTEAFESAGRVAAALDELKKQAAADDAVTDADRPPILCLCASRRFAHQVQQRIHDLTMDGILVLAPGFPPEDGTYGTSAGGDQAMAALHAVKIAMADQVEIVTDETGYFGASVAREIEHAGFLGKPVVFYRSAGGQPSETPSTPTGTRTVDKTAPQRAACT